MASLFATYMNTGSFPTMNVSHASSVAALCVPWIFPTIAIYALAVRLLRYRRVNGMIKRYGYTAREQLGKMTDQEAFEIVNQISEYEFPSMFEKALQLALFRTYGIPSISKLLVETTQLSKNTTVAKRYADTVVISSEIYANSPRSERAVESYARLNYLHGHYIKSGKISNDDMLYTLSLFMAHPVEWINRTEWRQLTDLEVCAIGVFHKVMGESMEIGFEKLPGTKSGFKDGLQFFDELTTWSKQYEQEFMLPHKDNYDTAVQTRTLFLSLFPSIMHHQVTNLVHAAMDERLRRAVMFEDPEPPYERVLEFIFVARKNYLRYLALPRFLKNPLTDEQASESGRRNLRRYEITPVYVKPTIWNRWGPGAWMNRSLGLPVPGDAGMMPEGFKMQECGPQAFFGKGLKEFDTNKQKVVLKNERRTGGCPFILKS